MIIEKRKRQSQSKLPVYLARCLLYFSIVYTVIAIIPVKILFNFYATIAGMMLMFFWPAVALVVFLALLYHEYRSYGQPIKAYATKLIIVAIGIASIGTFVVALTGFVR